MPAALTASSAVESAVTTSIIIGSVPAVLIGSLLSSRAPDRFIRPVITFVIFRSGLKYAGTGTTALGVVMAVVLAGAAGYWVFRALARGGKEQPDPAPQTTFATVADRGS